MIDLNKEFEKAERGDKSNLIYKALLSLKKEGKFKHLDATIELYNRK